MSRITRSEQQELLKALFERYHDRLLYFAWQYVHDKETARDLVRDAFVTYWRHAGNISSEEIPGRGLAVRFRHIGHCSQLRTISCRSAG